MEAKHQTHGDEDGFIKQVRWSLKEVQEERLSGGKQTSEADIYIHKSTAK